MGQVRATDHAAKDQQYRCTLDECEMHLLGRHIEIGLQRCVLFCCAIGRHIRAFSRVCLELSFSSSAYRATWLSGRILNRGKGGPASLLFIKSSGVAYEKGKVLSALGFSR